MIAATVLDPSFKKLNFLLVKFDKAAYYKFAAEAIDKRCPKQIECPKTDAPAKKVEETRENFLDFKGSKKRTGGLKADQRVT